MSAFNAFISLQHPGEPVGMRFMSEWFSWIVLLVIVVECWCWQQQLDQLKHSSITGCRTSKELKGHEDVKTPKTLMRDARVVFMLTILPIGYYVSALYWGTLSYPLRGGCSAYYGMEFVQTSDGRYDVECPLYKLTKAEVTGDTEPLFEHPRDDTLGNIHINGNCWHPRQIREFKERYRTLEANMMQNRQLLASIAHIAYATSNGQPPSLPFNPIAIPTVAPQQVREDEKQEHNLYNACVKFGLPGPNKTSMIQTWLFVMVAVLVLVSCQYNQANSEGRKWEAEIRSCLQQLQAREEEEKKAEERAKQEEQAAKEKANAAPVTDTFIGQHSLEDIGRNMQAFLASAPAPAQQAAQQQQQQQQQAAAPVVMTSAPAPANAAAAAAPVVMTSAPAPASCKRVHSNVFRLEEEEERRRLKRQQKELLARQANDYQRAEAYKFAGCIPGPGGYRPQYGLVVSCLLWGQKKHSNLYVPDGCEWLCLIEDVNLHSSGNISDWYLVQFEDLEATAVKFTAFKEGCPDNSEEAVALCKMVNAFNMDHMKLLEFPDADAACVEDVLKTVSKHDILNALESPPPSRNTPKVSPIRVTIGMATD